ncbi:MAG: polysaccharide biosynthesis/export family protein [Pleurocapsa sp.]
MHLARSLCTSLWGICWWGVASGLLPLAVYGQTSIKLPESATPTPPQPKPTVSPPRTDRPPEYSYRRDLPLEQFQIYRLDTGDGLNISVPLFPEFNAVVNIDPQGNVVLPILGRISLAGLTLTEVEAKIAYELSNRFLQEPPEVFAGLTAPRPAQISILGEVVRPGFYGFISGSPLTAALLAAGGSTNDADLRSITIRRTLVDGSQIEQNVDLYTPLITAKALPDVSLQGGDVIIVNKLKLGEDRNYDRSLVARTTLPQQTIQVRVLVPANTGTALRNLVLPNGSTFIDAISSLPPDDNLLVKEEIALLRFDPKTGDINTQRLNTRDVIQGNIAEDIPLQNEDVIVVSRTVLGKIFNAFNVITQPIRTLFGFRAFINTVFDTDN